MYLIKNGIVHVGDGRILDNIELLIVNQKIECMGTNLENRDHRVVDAKIIDAEGMHVYPGFIDPHSAIGALGLPTRYMDNDEISNPISPEMNIKYSIDPDELNAQEFYRSGITSIGVAPGNSNVIGGTMAVVKTAPIKMQERLVAEKVALKCSVSEEVKSAYGKKSKLPMTRMGIFHLLKESIRVARSKDENEKSGSDHIILDAVDKQKYPLFIAAQKKQEIDAIAHLFKEENVSLNIIEGFQFSDSIKAIKEMNAGLILGNINNMSQIAKNGMELDKLQELIDNGNLIAFTNTNGGYSEGREVYLWNAIECYRVGIDEEEIIKMMCENPAIMLGVEDRIGTLEEGKDADIVIFTDSPITSYAARVAHCFVNGKEVWNEYGIN